MYNDRNIINDFFQWDVKNWSKALPVWEKNVDWNKCKTALAIGERDGGLSLWLAKKGINVTCTDLNGPSDEAKKMHQAYGVGHLVTYANANAMELNYPDASFDLVVFKSVIGALSTSENQQTAINEMFRVLKPGGFLIFAENTSGSFLHQFARKRFIKWSTYWRYLEIPKDLFFFNSFKLIDKKMVGFFAAFGRSEGQRKFLSYIDWIFSPIIPKKWKYILIGVYQKN
jgi:ubiquinone/menaquinone biosynthesis C-methylase UbiE